MMKRLVAVIATGLVALAAVADLAAGVASTPPECPVCDCSSEISYLGRSAPVAIPVPEEYEYDHDDYAANDGLAAASYRNYAAPDTYGDYSAPDTYGDYPAPETYGDYTAADAYPAALDMGYGDYGLLVFFHRFLILLYINLRFVKKKIKFFIGSVQDAALAERPIRVATAGRAT